MDWVDIISRFVVAIPKPVGRALIFPLHVLPSFRKAKRVLRVVDEVSGLERCGNFDAAEQIREQALRLCEPGFTALLWRSKGFDRLRRNMPDEALAAFEAGYYIVPNFPATVFAIRTDRDNPKRNKHIAYTYNPKITAECDVLPAGEGEYKNPVFSTGL